MQHYLFEFNGIPLRALSQLVNNVCRILFFVLYYPLHIEPSKDYYSRCAAYQPANVLHKFLDAGMGTIYTIVHIEQIIQFPLNWEHKQNEWCHLLPVCFRLRRFLGVIIGVIYPRLWGLCFEREKDLIIFFVHFLFSLDFPSRNQ